MPPDLVVDVLDFNLAPTVSPTLLWLFHDLLFIWFHTNRFSTLCPSLCHPLLVFNALPIILALSGVLLLGLLTFVALLLGARLASVFDAFDALYVLNRHLLGRACHRLERRYLPGPALGGDGCSRFGRLEKINQRHELTLGRLVGR